MTTIAILTATYPYLPGEQFIEEEAEHWATFPQTSIVVMPMCAVGEPRRTPIHVNVDLCLVPPRGVVAKLVALLSALVSPLFWKEFWFVLRHHQFTPFCVAKAWLATAEVLRIRHALKAWVSRHGPIEIAYCYWNDVQAFAAALLKREGLVGSVVSRIHGFDLYQEARPHAYMPLKRQFLDDFDMFFPVSDHGRQYLEEVYHIIPAKIIVSRLGVLIPEQHAVITPDHMLNVVSVSYCAPEKRIDKIIDGIAELAARQPRMDIQWTHIGDGLLFDKLNHYATEKFSSTRVKWTFCGHLTNADVKSYLASNAIDVFVNASETEGIPVSIMEAMSYGIPIIAPDVGGIRELISRECGELLSANPDPAEIANAILSALPRLKEPAIKQAARHKVSNEYCATKNYSAFARRLVALANQGAIP